MSMTRRQQGLKPLFFYQGSKRDYLHNFKYLLRRCNTYIETHFGSGAVFCYMYNNKLFNNAIINDNDFELINLKIAIKERPNEFIENVQKIIDDYNSLPNASYTEKRSDGSRVNLAAKLRKLVRRGDGEFNKKHCYYEYRDLYHKSLSPAVFFFLMLTRFNGVVKKRWHKFGSLFLVAAGKCDKNIKLDTENILLWHKALQSAQICCCDYADIPIPGGDVLIYCDPVYYKSIKSYEQPEMATAKEQLRLLRYFSNYPSIISNISDGSFFEDHAPKLGYEIGYFDAKHFGHMDYHLKNVTEIYMVSKSYYEPVVEVDEPAKIQRKPVTSRSRVQSTFPHRAQPSPSLWCLQRSFERGNPPARLRLIFTGIPPPISAAPCRCNPSRKFLLKFEFRIATAIAGFFEIVDRPRGGQPPPIAQKARERNNS